MEMDEPIMGGGKRGQQRLSDTEVSHAIIISILKDELS